MVQQRRRKISLAAFLVNIRLLNRAYVVFACVERKVTCLLWFSPRRVNCLHSISLCSFILKFVELAAYELHMLNGVLLFLLLLRRLDRSAIIAAFTIMVSFVTLIRSASFFGANCR